MVACLSSLNRLESLHLGFKSRQSRPDQPRPFPQTRVLLPALIRLVFKGMSKYSEDLVAHIDTPVLNQLHLTFFSNPIFDVRHLQQFTSRSLYVSKDIVPLIALQELIGERTTEVLPNLCDLFLRGSARSRSIMESIQPFVDARQLSGRPVAVHYLRGSADSSSVTCWCHVFFITVTLSYLSFRAHCRHLHMLVATRCIYHLY
jgi:hypothetical protein